MFTINIAYLFRVKEEEMASLSGQVAQLRTYIGETREGVQTTAQIAQWQHQKLLLENRITVSNTGFQIGKINKSSGKGALNLLEMTRGHQ